MALIVGNPTQKGITSSSFFASAQAFTAVAQGPIWSGDPICPAWIAWAKTLEHIGPHHGATLERKAAFGAFCCGAAEPAFGAKGGGPSCRTLDYLLIQTIVLP